MCGRNELVSRELLPGSSIPLLKRRKEISRDEAIRVWRETRQAGRVGCSPQW
ncbi:DUF1651 domain-containing protein [Synechococcus sp. MW101C3]|uniref:DUF1651 domain-containing protein n=1 Tax=Synechococcus sp. MW101C3 TaxID=210768 RepID=UPI0035107530